MKALEFLDILQTDNPDLAEDISEIAALYQRKLWHPLAVKVESCLDDAKFNRGDIPYKLYLSFISDFGLKINLLKLAEFAVHAAKFAPNASSSLSFLYSIVEKLKESKLPRIAEPVLYLHMHIAQLSLEAGNISDCKTLVEEGRQELDKLTGADPRVSAAVFYVTSLYHKSTQNYAEFYRSSLMYLSYVSSESLPADFKLKLAIDISLAALLGEHIYSFGQLLQHPIVHVVEGSPFNWLYELLICFNGGDLHLYDELTAKYASILNSQPALVANEISLREKIVLMSLLEMISSIPAEDRKIQLSTIASTTKLTLDGVEFLLMKSLSLGLIEGIIDQIDGYIQITSVQPRILTKSQISGLKGRLDGWITKVNAIALTLEHESLGVVES